MHSDCLASLDDIGYGVTLGVDSRAARQANLSQASTEDSEGIVVSVPWIDPERDAQRNAEAEAEADRTYAGACGSLGQPRLPDRVDVRGLLTTALDHRDSRASDPDVHTSTLRSSRIGCSSSLWAGHRHHRSTTLPDARGPCQDRRLRRIA